MVRASDDGVVTKALLVREIQALARAGGARAGNYTGHTLRVTGAQQMALAGISEDKIRLFGRWASAAMLSYVRGSLLARSGLQVAKAVAEPAHQAQGGVAPESRADSRKETKRKAMWQRFTVAGAAK